MTFPKESTGAYLLLGHPGDGVAGSLQRLHLRAHIVCCWVHRVLQVVLLYSEAWVECQNFVMLIVCNEGDNRNFEVTPIALQQRLSKALTVRCTEDIPQCNDMRLDCQQAMFGAVGFEKPS